MIKKIIHQPYSGTNNDKRYAWCSTEPYGNMIVKAGDLYCGDEDLNITVEELEEIIKYFEDFNDDVSDIIDYLEENENNNSENSSTEETQPKDDDKSKKEAFKRAMSIVG